MLDPHERFLDDATQRLERGLTRIVDDADFTIEKLHASLTALSPQSTLNRGYAVVQTGDGHVVDDTSPIAVGDELTVTLRRGTLTATTTGVEPGH